MDHNCIWRGKMIYSKSETTVTILFTSDIHGHVLTSTNGECCFGLSKVATLLKSIQLKAENVLTIDNGDLIQGTPLTYYFAKRLKNKPNPMVLLLNELQYDAAIIGNHEFNYGKAIINQTISQSNFPWLSANIVHHRTKETYFGTPYIVKEFPSGIKVAVLGVTTKLIPQWERPEHIESLAFEDAVESTKRWVQYIHEIEQPDLMVVAYHGGFERDIHTGERLERDTGENQAYAMCQSVDGIDVLLTGHQHRELVGEVNGVTVIQAGSNGRLLGEVSVTFNKIHHEWHIHQKSANIYSVKHVKEDQQCLQLIKYYQEETNRWLNESIGKVIGDMRISNPFDVRLKEHPYIEFINKVQMEATGVNISCTALFTEKGKGLPANVKVNDIISNYIYPNTLVVLRVTGKDIKEALEKSASYFVLNEDGSIEVSRHFSYPKPQHYHYDMWEGIEYVINISRPIGERIESLTINGAPLQMDKEYDVVMNNYRASGGGNYHMFEGKERIKEVQLDVTELLIEYFMEHKEVEATVNNNWKVVW